MTVNILYRYARGALFHGLNALKISGHILVPDYICKSVVDSITRLNIPVLKYRIDESLTPDWGDLKQQLGSHNVAAILGVHYFGQPFDIYRYNELCREHGLLLIEDNAHGYGGYFEGKRLGTFGAIGISSPRKFINTYGGGVLHLNDPLFLPPEQKYFYGSLKSCVVNALACNPTVRSLIRGVVRGDSRDWNNPNLYKDDLVCDEQIDALSSAIIRSYDWDSLSKRRINKWNYLVDSFGKIGKPIWNEPLKNTNPWACPFILPSLNERNNFLNHLKNEGLEAFTWPYTGEVKGENQQLWNRVACILLD